MIDKKKLHFIQLATIFAGITVISLLYNWGFKSNAQDKMMSMMGKSMGSMMSSMHLENITLSELFKQEEQMEAMTGMSSHHETGNAIKFTHYITTGTIVILIPFIIAGAAFLAVIWLK